MSEVLGSDMTFVRPRPKAENTDSRTNYAKKNATARGHLTYSAGTVSEKKTKGNRK